jgi:hypothetical protein
MSGQLHSQSSLEYSGSLLVDVDGPVKREAVVCRE